MDEQSRLNWIAIGKLAESIRAMGATGDALVKLEDVKAMAQERLDALDEPVQSKAEER